MADIKKVWTCTYVGRNHQAPEMIQVPSIYTTPGPTLNEIEEALIKMGYSKQAAGSIKGSNLDWKCK